MVIIRKRRKIMPAALLLCEVILLICTLCGCAALPGNKTSNTEETVVPNESTIDETDTTEAHDPALTALQDEINQNGSVAGIAFIGYVDRESSEFDLRTCFTDSETGVKYPVLASAPIYITEGQELYAIVPPNDRGVITVYMSAMTEDGGYADDKSQPLYVGNPGETLLLRCNFSEIYSNVLITVTDGGGAIEFHPSLSMENGHIPEITGVYDFSIYEKLPDEQPVQNAEEILMKVDEVKTAVEQGMKIMYTGDTQLIDGNTCMVFALGTDRDEQFVREYYYGVCGNLVYVYDAIDDTWKIVI